MAGEKTKAKFYGLYKRRYQTQFLSMTEKDKNLQVIEFMKTRCEKLISGAVFSNVGRFADALAICHELEIAFQGSSLRDLKTDIRFQFFRSYLKECGVQYSAPRAKFTTDGAFLCFCLFYLSGNVSDRLPLHAHYLLRAALQLVCDPLIIAPIVHKAEDFMRQYRANCFAPFEKLFVNADEVDLSDDIQFITPMIEFADRLPDNEGHPVYKFCAIFCNYPGTNEELKRLFTKCVEKHAELGGNDFDLPQPSERRGGVGQTTQGDGGGETSEPFDYGFCKVFASNEKLQTEVPQCGGMCMITHVETINILYHGTIPKRRRRYAVSFFMVDDEDVANQVHEKILASKEIYGMMHANFPADNFPVGKFCDVERPLLCIEEVCSYNQWLLGKMTLFENLEGSVIQKTNIRTWIKYIERDMRIIFRQLIGAILDFWEKDLVPYDLRYSIFLARCGKVKLIPSPNEPKKGAFKIICDQLKDVLRLTIFPHLIVLTDDDYNMLSPELAQFCQSLNDTQLMNKIDKRFVLCSPFFWTQRERAHFLWILNNIRMGNVFPREFWSRQDLLGGSALAHGQSWWHCIPFSCPLDGVEKVIMGSYPLVINAFYHSFFAAIIAAAAPAAPAGPAAPAAPAVRSDFEMLVEGLEELKRAFECWNWNCGETYASIFVDGHRFLPVTEPEQK